MDIGPGTPLIFIGPNGPIKSGLTVDALYFVENIREFESSYVSLRGRPGDYIWYLLEAFRPIVDPPKVARALELTA